MILFTGGQLSNRNNPASVPLVIDDQVAQKTVWRDFQAGLPVAERAFFQPPPGNGMLTLTAAAAARLLGPGWGQLHVHVRTIMQAVTALDSRLFVMPMPVFDQVPPDQQWVTNIGRGHPGPQGGFLITINGYGRFPVEWVGNQILGRTHHLIPNARLNACVYGSWFGTQPRIDPAIVAHWHQSRFLGRRTGDTPELWLEREATVTLFHELVSHLIRAVGHRGPGVVDRPLFENVEQWARGNWQANHHP